MKLQSLRAYPGVPGEVVKRADKILENIDEHLEISQKKDIINKGESGFGKTMALETVIYDDICEKIKALDVNTLTPIEALTKLYEFKNMLDGK